MDFSDDSESDPEIVEIHPNGLYVRYNKMIGEGAWKKVYLGLDMVHGIEIAWSITVLTEEIQDQMMNHEMLCGEGDLIKSLKHENILRCYDSWIINDEQNKVKTIHMITELLCSGNLLEYATKHNLASTKAIKTLAIQILNGLHYLHTRIPRIVHRDIKCENIFVNGNTGSVKLGDFGIALRILEQSNSGTPGYLSIDTTQGPYDPLHDIYSFGMCILQMVTRERPYNLHEGKPAALSLVTDPDVKMFIEKCLANDRPKAIDLLDHPFLASEGSSQRPREPNMLTRLLSWVALLCTRQRDQE